MQTPAPAPRRQVSLELDAQVVARAEALSPDLAATVERLLAAHVAAEEADGARAHAAASHALVAREGLWGEEFSTL